MKRVTLLFAHGGGFCKEVWEPIIRRLRESPLLSTAAIECVTFDFKYHGGRRDETVLPMIDRSNPASVRVHHPAQDLVSWVSADAWEQVRALRAKSQAKAPLESQPKLIGVGHSMGAVALWKTEVEHPGTFDGLVLFEPGYGGTFSRGEKVKDFMVSVALEREKSWPTREAATLYFEQLKNYSKWDREVLAAYLRGALVDEVDGSVSLACHPHIEAALYCHEFLFLSDEQLARPECKVHFHFGDRTKMFIPETFAEIAAKFPSIYSLHPAMPNTSHVMVMEDPAQSAQRITKDLAGLEAFQPHARV